MIWAPLSPVRFRTQCEDRAWELFETPGEKYDWRITDHAGTSQDFRAGGPEHAKHRAEVWLDTGRLMRTHAGRRPACPG